MGLPSFPKPRAQEQGPQGHDPGKHDQSESNSGTLCNGIDKSDTAYDECSREYGPEQGVHAQEARYYFGCNHT